MVLVTVLGLGGEGLERVVDLAERQCAARGAAPVFLTDALDFTVFRRRRLTVDHLPRAQRPSGGPAGIDAGLPFGLYERRLFALAKERWKPIAIVSFGRRPPGGPPESEGTAA